jgi:hypothetical protein
MPLLSPVSLEGVALLDVLEGQSHLGQFGDGQRLLLTQLSDLLLIHLAQQQGFIGHLV